eukprot:CAMPEP_0114250996 /NCGR_PEP_ID=MMETSP0058-20121206/15017_1 /TAXON_ID=36894 /ORGANISM="Pyramimonas parkeae, CCMP726" /LENGTH=724 /DNA_ID=CAMNT_0001364733 /DNA_START=398 /DNA_END=2572 /DNA_ORIENTATION=+
MEDEANRHSQPAVPSQITHPKVPEPNSFASISRPDNASSLAPPTSQTAAQHRTQADVDWRAHASPLASHPQASSAVQDQDAGVSLRDQHTAVLPIGEAEALQMGDSFKDASASALDTSVANSGLEAASAPGDVCGPDGESSELQHASHQVERQHSPEREAEDVLMESVCTSLCDEEEACALRAQMHEAAASTPSERPSEHDAAVPSKRPSEQDAAAPSERASEHAPSAPSELVSERLGETASSRRARTGPESAGYSGARTHARSEPARSVSRSQRSASGLVPQLGLAKVSPLPPDASQGSDLDTPELQPQPTWGDHASSCESDSARCMESPNKPFHPGARSALCSVEEAEASVRHVAVSVSSSGDEAPSDADLDQSMDALATTFGSGQTLAVSFEEFGQTVKRRLLAIGRIRKSSVLLVRTEGYDATKHTPWFTFLTVMANLGMFLWVLWENDCPSTSHDCEGGAFLHRFAFERRKANPLLGPRMSTLVRMGAKSVHLMVNNAEIWRLVSAMYLHAGVVHVVLNMMSVVAQATRLEQDFGAPRVAAVWIISGTFSMMCSGLMMPHQITVGASGGACGLLGCSLAELLLNWGQYQSAWKSLTITVICILIQLLIGLAPYVDNVTHSSAIVIGFFVGLVLFIKRRYLQERLVSGPDQGQVRMCLQPTAEWQWLLVFISIPIVTCMYLAVLILMFSQTDVKSVCPDCYAVDCAPLLNLWECEDTDQL